MFEKYDKNDKFSIYEYSKKLINKSFREVSEDFESDKKYHDFLIREASSAEEYSSIERKGGLGELLEEKFYFYSPDNYSQADFPDANLELKVSPYKINKNKTISAKERVSISMINYFDIIEDDFFESNVWSKIENILFIYYEWKEEVIDRLDYIIKHVHLYSPDISDLKIIINDYNKIKKFILEGRAHELSEGDTMYLGAATKSSNASVLTKQPNSEIMAKPRTFSFKNSYMTYLLRNNIAPKNEQLDSIVSSNVDSNFEDFVLHKINKYKGYSDFELEKIFFGDNLKSKDKYSRLAYKILGVRTKNALEFEKANIVVKAIRINKKGKIKESMSFPTFKVMELVEEEWETSDINKYFSETKFLFVTFKEENNKYILDKSFFWNMPYNELEGDLKNEWTRARDTFREGVIFNFRYTSKGLVVGNNTPKLSNTNIMHVRNHSTKSAYLINGVKYGEGKIGRDTDILPNGDYISKQCFWLNNKYIIKIIFDNN